MVFLQDMHYKLLYVLISSIKHVKKEKLGSEWKIAGRWQHAKNASMVEIITIKNNLRLATSLEVSRLTISKQGHY